VNALSALHGYSTGMDWLLILILLVAAYAAIAFVIHRNKLWEEHIVFYGPIMAIRTTRIGFFDKFAAFRTFFRIYGTAGVIAVIIVSVFITVMLFISVRYTLMIQPEPTGIYEPQNILLLPGINEYVPSTFAVWLAFIITIVVHEFGHAMKKNSIRPKVCPKCGCSGPVLPTTLLSVLPVLCC